MCKRCDVYMKAIFSFTGAAMIRDGTHLSDRQERFLCLYCGVLSKFEVQYNPGNSNSEEKPRTVRVIGVNFREILIKGREI